MQVKPQTVYLSMDPNAGQSTQKSGGYLSTDPNSGKTQAPPEKPETAAHPHAQVASMIGDAILGAIKGGGETAFNLGRMVHKIPGVSMAVDTMFGQEGLSKASFAEDSPLREDLKPTNTAQTVGKGAERLAELVLPASRVGQVAEAAMNLPRIAQAGRAAQTGLKAIIEGAGGAGMSAAQGGDPLTGAVLGGVGSAASSGVSALAGPLRESAEKGVMQALGPTKERFKAMTEKLTPQILTRGIKGSREAIQQRASAMVDDLAPQIDDAIQNFGRTHDPSSILSALEDAKDAYRLQVPAGGVGAGATRTVVLDARPIKQLERLQDTLSALGDAPTTEQLVAVRRAWDTVVGNAGGYAQRAGGNFGLPLKEQSEAWAKREGASAIRKLLADDVPELAALNKEFSFWKGLDDVVSATLKRTGPQSSGVGSAIAEGAGRVAGAAAGVPAGAAGAVTSAYFVGKAAKLANDVFTSPSWRLTSANLKNALADSIASGNQAQSVSILRRIAATQASQLPVLRPSGSVPR